MTENDEAAPDTPEGSTGEESGSGGEPERAPITTLVDYFSETGPDRSKRLVRHLAQTEPQGLTEDDIQAALSILDDADPELRQLRTLLASSIAFHRGAARKPIVDFAQRVLHEEITIADEVGAPSDPSAALKQAAGKLLVDADAPPAAQRRGVNALMIYLDLLAAKSRISYEDAHAIMRSAVGEPREYSGPQVNRRRSRIGVLEDAITIDRLRGLLDLAMPWVEAVERFEGRIADIEAENDGLNWPHCDGLKWPHLVRLSADDAVLISSMDRGRGEWVSGWSSLSRSGVTAIGRGCRSGRWPSVTGCIAGRCGRR